MRASEYAISERTLPAGVYYVGDPCYAFDDHILWGRLLEAAKHRENPVILEAEAQDAAGNTVSFVASRTAFGDGTFLDESGREYPVDAGLIGVVPVADKRLDDDEYAAVPFGMQEVVFEKPFSVEYDDGVISVGGIAINTDPTEEEECEECGETSDWCRC